MNLPVEVIAILANTIDLFFSALTFLIVLRILLSWLAPHSRGQIVYFIVTTTQPILGFFQKFRLRIGMIDFSPIVALLVLDFVRMILLKLIYSI